MHRKQSRSWVDGRSIAVAESLRPPYVALAEGEERLTMVSTENEDISRAPTMRQCCKLPAF